MVSFENCPFKRTIGNQESCYTKLCSVKLRQEITDAPDRKAFVPMFFAHGEAFQFDWSCEYVWIAGLRRRLEVSHCKLASSRAFWMVAYFTQSHEMLFDAHMPFES